LAAHAQAGSEFALLEPLRETLEARFNTEFESAMPDPTIVGMTTGSNA
jgi:hypothetical protein